MREMAEGEKFSRFLISGKSLMTAITAPTVAPHIAAASARSVIFIQKDFFINLKPLLSIFFP
jgi:hypothetical protein